MDHSIASMDYSLAAIQYTGALLCWLANQKLKDIVDIVGDERMCVWKVGDVPMYNLNRAASKVPFVETTDYTVYAFCKHVTAKGVYTSVGEFFFKKLRDKERERIVARYHTSVEAHATPPITRTDISTKVRETEDKVEGKVVDVSVQSGEIRKRKRDNNTAK